MKPSAKDTAALVIGIGKPRGEPEATEEKGVDSDKDMLASEVMDAMKSGDVGAFRDALSSFVSACNTDYEGD
jgi:hypothetical protein